MTAMLAHVGVDANKDINWVTHPPADSMRLLAEGKVDAYLWCSPGTTGIAFEENRPLDLSMTTDRPWSEHYCCVFIARRDYVKANPVATKRALRAILKATSICTGEPERATRVLVERKLTDKYDYALQMMKELPFSRWRDYDPWRACAFMRCDCMKLGSSARPRRNSRTGK